MGAQELGGQRFEEKRESFGRLLPVQLLGGGWGDSEEQLSQGGRGKTGFQR